MHDENLFAFLPLAAFFVNLILGCYVLYRNHRSELNIIYSLFLFTLAIWALSDYLVLSAPTPNTALSWNSIGIVGSALMPVFLLRFILTYTKRQIHIREATKAPVYMLMYVPAIFFSFVGLSTNLITERMEESWMGYAPVPGPMYAVFSMYATLYVIVSLAISIDFLIRTRSREERVQARLVVIAVAIPTVGGLLTQVLPPFFGLQTIQLTTTLTAAMGAIIAYAVVKHKLMTPTFFSIQKKLAVTFLGLILIISPVTSITGFAIAKDATQGEVYSLLESVALSRATDVEKFLDENKDDIELLTVLNPIADLLTMDRTNQSRYSDALNVANDLLNGTLSAQEEFLKITLLEMNGSAVATTGVFSDTAKGLEVMETLVELGFFSEDIHPDEDTGGPSMNIAFPVRDENGVTRGGILADVDLTLLYEILEDRRGLGESGKVYLVNRSMIMVSPSRFYDDLYNEEYIIYKQVVDTVNSRECFAEGRNESVNAGNLEMLVFQDYRGEDVVGTHAFIPEMEWALLAEMDESEALAPLYSMQSTLILILASLAFVGTVFSFMVSKSISRPIMQLTQAAEKIGKGDLTTKIDVKSVDEVGLLAQTLTQMQGDLKASRARIEEYSQTLEKRVAERTKELEARQNELDDKIERLRKSEAASLNIMEDLNQAFEDQKKAEERITRQNLVLQAIREVDQLIAREKDRDNLISGACSSLIKTRGYDGAWIALMEESGDLVSTAEAGLGGSFKDLAIALTGDGALHCAKLIMDGPGVVVIEDPTGSCHECPLCNVHQGNASMAIRLESGWKVFGMMCVSASPEVVIDEEELALFEEVAMDISFALYSIELEEKRRSMEVNLRESEEKYRALFEASADGILIADIETKTFKYANPAMGRMLGYSTEELENMAVTDIHPEDSLDSVVSEFLAQAKGEKVLAEDIPCIKKDGTIICTDISTAKAMVDGSECNIGFFRDTTERNRMIKDLETTNEELRATQSHLIQSEKLASIGMLASGIAHEINNPLAAITGYAEAIMDEDDVKLKTDYASKILSASGRASEVVRWLSKHSRDAKVDTVGDVHLNDVLNDSLESVRLAKPSPDIEIQKDFEGIPLIEGNKNEVQQIFVNLINNATDAMPNGGRLMISTSIEDGYVKASIADTGEGIPKDHLTKIFDPFFTTKEVGEGTGLGLYVTSMIVLRHQGRMEVESEVGKGTIFTVRFPIKGEMNNLGNNKEPAQAGA